MIRNTIFKLIRHEVVFFPSPECKNWIFQGMLCFLQIKTHDQETDSVPEAVHI